MNEAMEKYCRYWRCTFDKTIMSWNLSISVIDRFRYFDIKTVDDICNYTADEIRGTGIPGKYKKLSPKDMRYLDEKLKSIGRSFKDSDDFYGKQIEYYMTRKENLLKQLNFINRTIEELELKNRGS